MKFNLSINSHKSKRFFRVMFSRKVIVLCLLILVIMAVFAVFAPLIAPYDPYKQDLNNTLQPMSADHIFGTDAMGRDTFSRIIYGTRISFSVGIASVAIAGVLGMVLGVTAGVVGGVVDTVIMRVMDAMLSMPLIVLAIFLGAIIGKGLGNVMLAVGISTAPTYARLTRGQVLTLKGNDFITASTICGSSRLRTTIKHILPNSISPNIVLMTMNLGTAILAEANLSFLGLGINPPLPSWGGMVSDGNQFIRMNPVMAVAPGVFILLMVLCFNMVGDAVRDALDPRLKGSL